MGYSSAAALSAWPAGLFERTGCPDRCFSTNVIQDRAGLRSKAARLTSSVVSAVLTELDLHHCQLIEGAQGAVGFGECLRQFRQFLHPLAGVIDEHGLLQQEIVPQTVGFIRYVGQLTFQPRGMDTRVPCGLTDDKPSPVAAVWKCVVGAAGFPC